MSVVVDTYGGIQRLLMCGQPPSPNHSTHGLNCYGFEQTTLLILHDLNQEFPRLCFSNRAFMFSNREDSAVFEVFVCLW